MFASFSMNLILKDYVCYHLWREYSSVAKQDGLSIQKEFFIALDDLHLFKLEYECGTSLICTIYFLMNDLD